MVEIEDELNEERLKEATGKLDGLTISQRTPVRVSHRRGDLVRKRQVKAMSGTITASNKATLIIMGDLL